MLFSINTEVIFYGSREGPIVISRKAVAISILRCVAISRLSCRDFNIQVSLFQYCKVFTKVFTFVFKSSRNCGHNVEINDNFCTKCGSKCEAKVENDGVEVLNFSMFKTKKEEKRRSFFGQKKRKTTTTSSEESEVKINVGVISENSKGNLSKERGSRHPSKGETHKQHVKKYLVLLSKS